MLNAPISTQTKGDDVRKTAEPAVISTDAALLMKFRQVGADTTGIYSDRTCYGVQLPLPQAIHVSNQTVVNVLPTSVATAHISEVHRLSLIHI